MLRMEEDALHKICSALLFKLPSYCFIRKGTLEDNTSEAAVTVTLNELKQSPVRPH